MDSSKFVSQIIPEEVQIIEERFNSIESHLEKLLKEIDNKNICLEKINKNYYNSLKENDEIKSKFLAVQEKNHTCRKELLDLRNLVSNQIEDNIIIDKFDNLINKFEIKNNEQLTLNGNLLKVVELESKLLKYEDDLSCLAEKNEIFNKIIQSKNDYVNFLLKFIHHFKKEHSILETSFKNELKIQNDLVDSLRNELCQMKSQNRDYENKLEHSNKEINLLSQQLNEKNKDYKDLQEKYNKSNYNHEIEKENHISEINKLNNLFEQSKSNILEKYLEKFYPNISIINQMFDKKLSICEIYSNFLETQNINKNLSIEKSVLEERLQTLTNDLDDMKNSMDNYLEEIQKLKQLEGILLKLENENKELNISLKFYQNSTHSLYNGAKVFYDNFINLSDKIKLLVKHETNQINEDSTGMMALKYIMELQNNFQEFNRLQTEFERQKLDFINEKKNIIESENKIDLLNNKISLFEVEKRQMSSRYELLENEYKMLDRIFNNFKSKSEVETVKLEKIANDLNNKVEALQNSNVELESKLKELLNQIELAQHEKNVLQDKLNISAQQNEFSNERLIMQVKIVSQLEKSLSNFRKQNENLMKSKEQLENNLGMMEKRNREYSNKIVEIDSKLSAYKFEIDLLRQKENVLLQRLEDAHKISNKNSELDFILDSLKKNKCTIDENLIKTLEQLQLEKESLNKLYEKKEKQWSEEKSIFIEKVVQLENNLTNEINRNTELDSQLLKLSSTLNVDESSNEQIEISNRLSELSKQNGNLIQELNELKLKLLSSGQENLSLIQTKNQLELQLDLLNEEKSKIESDLNTLKTDSQTKLVQLENKFKNNLEALEKNFQQQDTQLQNKGLTCDIYEKKINSLYKTMEELKTKVEKKKHDYDQLKIIKQSYDMMEHELDTLKKQYSEEKQIYEILKTKMTEYQNRFVECETSRITQESQFISKLNNIRNEYDQLQNEYNALIKSNENLNEVILKLSSNTNLLKEKLENNQLITNEEYSLQLSTLNNVLENLIAENKFWTNRYKTFGSKENRFNSEIQTLKATIENLEECLQREKENTKNMKELFKMEQKPDFNQFSQIFQQNNKLTNKCNSLQSIIEKLNRELLDQSKTKSNMTEMNDDEIKALKSQLQVSDTTIKELNGKMISLQEKISKSEQEYSKLSNKFQQQLSEFDSLNKEHLSNSNLIQKYLNESNNYKSINVKLKEEATDLQNKISSLQKEISSIQNTNHQLKILARKYKSQCDEYQKTKNSNITEESVQKELESKLQNLSLENKKLQQQIDKLNQENEILRSETEESKQKARSITQQVKQKFSNFKRMITDRDNEIGFLKSFISNPENSCMIPGISGKMPVSSTIVSASSQQPSTSTFESSLFSSNIQPSSSNEDNDRLQSAQISSHTTSMDENSLESFFQNQVTASSSNKRRFSEQNTSNQDIIKKKRENDTNINQNEIKQNEDSTDVSETCQIVENNSITTVDNNVILSNETHNADQSHQEHQTESNDGNASSTDSSSHLDHPLNFTSNSSQSILGDVTFHPTISTSTNNPVSTKNLPSLITQFNSNNNSAAPVPSSVQRRSIVLNSDRSPQTRLFRSQNLMMPTNLESSCLDEDRIVPSTPVFYSPNFQFETSLQVSQPNFASNNSNINMVNDDTPITPTISETVSSLISVDEFESNPSARQLEDFNQEDPISSTPSSSDNVSQMTTTNSENQSGNVPRSRKLKIHNSGSKSRP